VDAITKHHYQNIAQGKTKELDDGNLATVRTIIVEIDGVETLIPTVWEGEIVSNKEAIRLAKESGVDWPTRTGENAVQELQEFDTEIHKNMTDMTSPEEASQIIEAANDNGFDDGGIILETSLRPQARPMTELPYSDIEKIEKVVWAEARGESLEGRDAVRGVILNRLSSDRFPDTVDEVLNSTEFEPIETYGSISSIPAPQDDLENQIQEFVDYIQLGDDAVEGRTFFQNSSTTEGRGTDFTGPDAVTIGNHTFTRGYEGQEPVLDTRFSHNIQITYPEIADANFFSSSEMALGGLMVARKGIDTEEGLEMANKKFQVDEEKSDLNDDGELSSYEKARGEAIQKAMADDPEADEKPKMYHGGMACDGMMGPVDPVSGNPIPVGSNADEVRDDIEVMLSQGEYVLPADVVKWHGLKHIMDMQEEAKMGLMAMDSMGLIAEVDMSGSEEDVTECPMCEGRGCEHCNDTGYHSEDEDTETPEGNKVETAEVEVSEEEPEVDETEEYQESDYSTKTSMFGMVKKPKVTFIV
jgi:hypothetical protein